MIPRYKPYFNLEEIKSILQKKEDVVYEFEKKFAEVTDSKYAVSFPSGRSGLFSILKTLDMCESEIITPAFTCLVVPAAIIASDNIPRFVDISLKDYNMNVEDTYLAISKKTKAVVPTHMYGHPLDVKRLREIVGEDVHIIEDACQSILTKDVGRYGDAAFYSFNLEKQLFTFGGGMVTTNNEEIYEKIIAFNKENFMKDFFLNELKKTFLLFVTPIIFSDFLFKIFCSLWEIHGSFLWKKQGWNLNDKNLPVKDIYLSGDFADTYSNIQAAVGLVQLNKIKENINKRIEIGKIYNEKLKNKNNIILPILTSDSSYAHYTIRVKDRKTFELFMRKKGIQINKVFEYSLPHIPRFACYVKKGETFNNSLIAGKNNANLPIYPQLINKPHKLNHIVQSVKEYSEKFVQN